MPYRHTIIFDDSFNQLWRMHTHRTVVDARCNQSFKNSGGPASCSQSMRVKLRATGYLRMNSVTPVQEHALMSLQLWVQARQHS